MSMIEATKCSLRNDILAVYDRCKDTKQITYYQLQSIKHSAEIYFKLKGYSFVKDVVNGGSAQQAGILPNDVIVAIEGRKIQNFDDLRENVTLAKVGQVINVTINRQGATKIIPLKLKAGG